MLLRYTVFLALHLDDVGAASLNAYGGVRNATPHLTQMAANGRLYEHMFAMPICAPTRYSSTVVLCESPPFAVVPDKIPHFFFIRLVKKKPSPEKTTEPLWSAGATLSATASPITSPPYTFQLTTAYWPPPYPLIMSLLPWASGTSIKSAILHCVRYLGRPRDLPPSACKFMIFVRLPFLFPGLAPSPYFSR